MAEQKIVASPAGDEPNDPFFDVLGFGEVIFAVDAGALEGVDEDFRQEGREDLGDDHENLGEDGKPVDFFGPFDELSAGFKEL